MVHPKFLHMDIDRDPWWTIDQRIDSGSPPKDPEKFSGLFLRAASKKSVDRAGAVSTSDPLQRPPHLTIVHLLDTGSSPSQEVWTGKLGSLWSCFRAYPCTCVSLVLFLTWLPKLQEVRETRRCEFSMALREYLCWGDGCSPHSFSVFAWLPSLLEKGDELVVSDSELLG